MAGPRGGTPAAKARRLPAHVSANNTARQALSPVMDRKRSRDEADDGESDDASIDMEDVEAEMARTTTTKKPRKQCEHGREPYYCKDCGGLGICTHGRLRKECKACGGSQLCTHGRRRDFCKDCGGSGLCTHGKRRGRCKDCGGSELCTHGRLRGRCKDCGGSQICTHGRQRGLCKDCGGSGICAHGRLRARCKDCITIDKAQNNKIFCTNCAAFLSSTRRRLGIRRCAECDKQFRLPRIEHIVRDKLVPLVNYPVWLQDDHSNLLGGEGCCQQKRRPDLLWCRLGEQPRAVFVENDEKGGHPDRETSCELAKIEQQSTAIKQLLGEDVQTFALRFNPDQFDGRLVTLDERVATLATEINRLLDEEQPPSLVPRVQFFFYHSSCQKHIDAARAAKDSMEVTRVWQ